MTISSETSRNSYAGNDVTVEFAVEFYFLINADIKVILYNSTADTETELTEVTHYTLVGAGEAAGGTLTMITAPASNEQLVILRDVPVTQERDYIEYSNFPAESHEQALDKLTMLVQQYLNKLERVIRFRETSSFTEIEFEDLVAGKILVVNGAGEGISMGGTYAEGYGFLAPTELTIDAGIIAVTGSSKWRFHSIDTEGDAASDNLTTINGGNAGEILILQAINDARTIVCQVGASLKLSYEYSLNNIEDKLMLVCISSGVWHELTRSSNS